jgi:hypothetical protein
MAVLLSAIALSACARSATELSLLEGGTSGGNPSVGLAFAPYTAPVSEQMGTSEIQDLSFCLQGIHFVPSVLTSSEINVPLGVLVTPTVLGTTLQSVTIPTGSYSKILLEISATCGPTAAFSFTNQTGQFHLPGPIVLEFDQSPTDPTGHTVSMDLQPMYRDLATVTTLLQAETVLSTFRGGTSTR